MLLNPPPGYSPSAINRQNVRNTPGQQGMEAQGYTQGAPAGSMLPSSYLPPSSTPNPFAQNPQTANTGYAPMPPQQQQQSPNYAFPRPSQRGGMAAPSGGVDVMSMIRALGGRNG